MESKRQLENPSQPSEVAKFYDGKSVFITGAAGFIGTVLLEILLRCCPGIERIYILLRPKKGVSPDDRKGTIFKKMIFNTIKEKHPDVLNKVVVVSGDISHDNLGMSSEDAHKVSEDVSVVFHIAATISFFKPLSFMIKQNVIGTKNILELCRKMKKLEALVYTSTAYSNSNRFHIEEKIYKLPFRAEEVLNAVKTGGEEELMHLYSKCEPKFPNFYTFSKNVCETLCGDASDLPTVIVRPSLVICCIKGPHPGYIEDGTGLTTISLGIGKGFIRVMFCDPQKRNNQIPVDIVANNLIIGAYKKVVDNLPSPYVYNCVASPHHAWKWGTFIDFAFDLVLKHPLPNSFQKPSITVCNNKVKYWILSICDHYAPAAVIDSILLLTGRKPRLFNLYRFYERNMEVSRHFVVNEWTFKNENFLSAGDKLNSTDKELFPVELTSDYTLDNLAKILVSGAPFFQKDYADAYGGKNLQLKYVPQSLTLLIKWAILGGLAASALCIAIF